MPKNIFIFLSLTLCLLTQCAKERDPHQEMIGLLEKARRDFFSPQNPFCPEAKFKLADSLLRFARSGNERMAYSFLKAQALTELGQEENAIPLLETMLSRMDENAPVQLVMAELGIAQLRLGERTNCISNHAAESCIMPIKGLGVHRDEAGSRKAIGVYNYLLDRDPNDLASRWLLNLAYMTLGEYPGSVPEDLLIPGLKHDSSGIKVAAYTDIAGELGLDSRNASGGSVVDDFDNDGYLDIITSSWSLWEPLHYFRNQGDGSFKDVSQQSDLKSITGGLNIMQTDYNNDGWLDLFVLRGGWQKGYGKQPNSLLKNNGDGTFSDVTTIAGLLSFHPTQTATWNDFNNDGWLDLFIGNESTPGESHPCELFINNQDGTFTDIAPASGTAITDFVKGVTSGDYDNDGDQDIFLSTLSNRKYLFRNELQGGKLLFKDATTSGGLSAYQNHSFPTWFWDYNNDGWLDILITDYTFEKPLSYFTAAEAMNQQPGCFGSIHLFENDQHGAFKEVTDQTGLCYVAHAMGSNYGDIDNDGYLDFYLGTGNPDYKSVVPNKLFKNIDGKTFADVTYSSRTGHLQKGHGVSFADLDNDGDQDIYCEMGGAYPGDAYQNTFYLRPGQGSNQWICLSLEGKQANRMAIGSRVKITITENGKKRVICRDVTSGGSFGASPLRREIGLGTADLIDELEITWGGSNVVQVLKNITPKQFLIIREGEDKIVTREVKMLSWKVTDPLCVN